MSGFDWSRGDLADEGRPARTSRRREVWVERHDRVFASIVGQQPKRRFPEPPPAPKPIARLKRKPINWKALFLFTAGVVGGWLLSR